MAKIKEENKKLTTIKIWLNRAKLFLMACFVLAFIGNAKIANAANLYIAPSSGSYTVGQTFSINIFVSSADQAMNAVSGNISFSKDKLEALSISKSGSIINLWVQEPSFSNSAGIINFEGVALNPGFTGSAGKIITVSFKAKAAGNAFSSFSSGSVLANDGQGTNILTGMGGGNYIISLITKQKPTAPKPKSAPIKEAKGRTETSQETVQINKPQIISPTHPDQSDWYNNDNIKFKWELPYGVTGVSILLDNKAISNPGPISDGLFSTKNYQNVESGIWYLHLKFKDANGWGEIEHFKIQIDTEKPKLSTIEVSQKETLTWPVLNFKAKDAVSGIDRYEIKINGKDFILSSDKTSVSVPKLEPGKYTAFIKAVDKAGNESVAYTDFTIEPIEAPAIKNFSREIKSTDQLFISGSALEDARVDVFIQKQGIDKIITQTSQSDKNGNWYLIYEDELTDGTYFAWAQTVNSQGMKSKMSNKINFLVTPPIFVKIGSLVINYFTVFIILLSFTILAISALSYWAGSMRNRLKKEVNEAQTVLHKNLKELKKLIEKEINYLNKNNIKGKQTIKTKRILNSRTNFIEKKITKEIQDIKNLLD